MNLVCVRTSSRGLDSSATDMAMLSRYPRNMSTDDQTPGAGQPGTPRQAIVKAGGGSRRARLEPAPNTDPSPDVPVEREEGGVASVGGDKPAPRGENDDRLRLDRPPHW